jgi:rhodanese-related sulfurtransferase
VREPDEFAAGHIPGAVHLRRRAAAASRRQAARAQLSRRQALEHGAGSVRGG